MDFLTSARDETLKEVFENISSLISASDSIKQDDQIFQRYFDCIIHLRDLLIKIQSHQQSIESISFLHRLQPEIENARQIILRYKSKNPISRLFICSSVASNLKKSYKEILAILQILPFFQINTALKIEETADAVIRDMELVRVGILSRANAIVSCIDSNGCESSGRFAFGKLSSCVCPLPVQIEINESEGEKSRFDSYQDLAPSSFFLCLLTGEVMEDPVTLCCDHGFERKAIEAHFDEGKNFCPICYVEICSIGRLELTSNSALRNSILEWKRREDESVAERDAKKKIMETDAKLDFDNSENRIEVLCELQCLMMETPSCISAATESSCKIVPKLAEMLKKNSSGDVSMVLKCLLLIARFSDENKEIIGRRGVIKCLLEQSMLCEPNALAVLLELSRNKVVAEKIGGISYSISILISLLDNPSSAVAAMAGMVLENLASIDINSTFVMAKFGYFSLFLELFNSQELPEETRALMAEELSQIQLTEISAKNLNNERFISHLTQMLTSYSPSTTMASLNSIKQLITFDEPKSRFLLDESTIPSLLHLLKSNSTAQEAKQKALEILISLFQTTPLSNPAFESLFSADGVRGVINHIKSSAPDDQISLLRLLLAMVRMSVAAAQWIVSDDESMCYLFSSISMEQNSKVKINALNLIYCIAEDHHMVLPIPSSPSIESIVHSLVAILVENDQELPSSDAAAILIHLAPDHDGINKLLQSSDLLKSIKPLIDPSSNSHYSTVEKGLGVLLRCVNQSSLNFEFERSVGDLLRADLIRILSVGSPLAKRRATMILSHISRSIAGSSSRSSSSLSSRFVLRRLVPRRSVREGVFCPLHKGNCSSERIICLAMDRVVKPLIEIVRTMEVGSTDAALMALDTMFGPGCDADGAAAAIVEAGGAAAILEALERGEPSVKEKAFKLFCKIRAHPDAEKKLDRFKGLVLNMVRNGGGLEFKEENLMKHLFV